MKKLTYYSMKGCENDGYYLIPKIEVFDAVQKLADYENTELEPQEVIALKERVVALENAEAQATIRVKFGYVTGLFTDEQRAYYENLENNIVEVYFSNNGMVWTKEKEITIKEFEKIKENNNEIDKN